MTRHMLCDLVSPQKPHLYTYSTCFKCLAKTRAIKCRQWGNKASSVSYINTSCSIYNASIREGHFPVNHSPPTPSQWGMSSHSCRIWSLTGRTHCGHHWATSWRHVCFAGFGKWYGQKWIHINVGTYGKKSCSACTNRNINDAWLV